LPDGTFSFRPKISDLGKFWRALQWKVLVQIHLVYFMAIWSILWPFGIFYDYLVHLFPRFGMLCLEKSGSTA
jgi:hypothetical protein